MIEDNATTQHAIDMAEAIHETIIDDYVDEDEWVVVVEDETIVVKHEPPKGEQSRDLEEFAVNP